ncbi:MAG: linear amide C-N hydrolase [Phycisphaerales bacterium]
MKTACIAVAGLASLVALGASVGSAEACTAFQLRSQDGAWIYFRSMEFGVEFDSKVLIVPRGTRMSGTAPGGGPGLQWTAKYGVVGCNVNVAPSVVADGMNERGLVIGMLYLPGYSEYLPADPAKADRSVGSWEAPIQLLSTCADVEEAIDALRSERVYVAQQEFVPFKMVLQVHYYIADATGRVVIAEWVGGKLNLHENPLGVLTNSPPFDWQRINVGNYVNLESSNVPSITLGSQTIRNFGQGSGALGLPGDFTPPSRFVRAALFSHWATPAKTAPETVNLGFHVLNGFDIFEGAVTEKSSSSAAASPTDTTEWTICHDRTNRRMYVRTYESLEIELVDLAKIDFSKPGMRTIDLSTTFAPRDISENAKPAANGK